MINIEHARLHYAMPKVFIRFKKNSNAHPHKAFANAENKILRKFSAAMNIESKMRKRFSEFERVLAFSVSGLILNGSGSTVQLVE